LILPADDKDHSLRAGMACTRGTIDETAGSDMLADYRVRVRVVCETVNVSAGILDAVSRAA
jgi:hypothetical protein